MKVPKVTRVEALELIDCKQNQFVLMKIYAGTRLEGDGVGRLELRDAHPELARARGLRSLVLQVLRRRRQGLLQTTLCES